MDATSPPLLDVTSTHLYKSYPAANLEPLVGVSAFSVNLANRRTTESRGMVRCFFAGDPVMFSMLVKGSVLALMLFGGVDRLNISRGFFVAFDWLYLAVFENQTNCCCFRKCLI